MANTFNLSRPTIVILDFGSQCVCAPRLAAPAPSRVVSSRPKPPSPPSPRPRRYSHIIARRVRDLKVYCEMHSCLVKEAVLRAMNVKGIILSGGPFSVYEEGAPHLDPAIWALAAEKGIPVLGICYGFQEMAHALGGKVEKAPHREFGHAEVDDGSGGGGGGGGGGARSSLLAGLSNPLRVWMSHGD